MSNKYGGAKVPENLMSVVKFRRDRPADIFILDSGNISDELASKMILNVAVHDNNPLDLTERDFWAMDDELYEMERLDNKNDDEEEDDDEPDEFIFEYVPMTVKELFETMKMNESDSKFQDLTDIVDEGYYWPELFGAIDETSRFAWIDLNDQMTRTAVLARPVPYMLAKFNLKEDRILLRLYLDAVFVNVKDPDGKIITVFNGCSRAYEFYPYKGEKK